MCSIQTSAVRRPTTSTATYKLHSPLLYRVYAAFTKIQHYVLSNSSPHAYIKINGNALSGVRHETRWCIARPNRRTWHRFYLSLFFASCNRRLAVECASTFPIESQMIREFIRKDFKLNPITQRVRIWTQLARHVTRLKPRDLFIRLISRFWLIINVSPLTLSTRFISRVPL